MKLKKISTSALAILLIVAIIGASVSVFSAFGIKIRNFFDKKTECKHTLIEIPGHPPSCTELGWDTYYACDKCNYTTKAFVKETGHTIHGDFVKYGEIHYICDTCGLTYESTNGLSTMTDAISYGNDGNSNNFTVQPGTQAPLYQDGAYKFIKTTATTDYKQAQFWFPSGIDGFDILSENNAVAVLDFRLNVNLSRSFEMMLVEGADSNRWSSTWCITDPVFSIRPTLYTEGYAEYSLLGCNNLELKRVVSREDAYTGYFRVTIGIVLDQYTDTIRFYYYLDGQYIGTTTEPLTTLHNSIRSVYASLKTAPIGSGVEISDFYFGYSNDAVWVFNE